MTWNPQQYLQFEDHRLRPAVDLLARVRAPRRARSSTWAAAPATSRASSRERWPARVIVGVDNSPTMLAQARAATADLPRVRFVERRPRDVGAGRAGGRRLQQRGAALAADHAR